MKALIYVILGLDLPSVSRPDVPQQQPLRGEPNERYSHYLHIPQERF